ncbi:MAG: 1-acyl-sn-glycerol-3-phosphate acyltransferase [Bdellovibrionales bacterium]|nr:1-acyl-sn-glycerol-3-phosphate acyltransferase [Bdellovibrionales bacterium]
MTFSFIVRFIFLVFLIVSYTVISWLLGLLPFSRWTIQKWRAQILSRFCKVGLWNLRVQVKNFGLKNPNENYLVVSNHLSYLDILIISSQIPSCFVTSVEIKETPLLGLLTKLGGCLYVERRNKSNIHNEIKDIREGLENNLNVVVFPEATSTNGESVLRFRSPLYNASISSYKKVLPTCINYRSVGHTSLNKDNRDAIFWYGDMSFFPHLVGLVKAGPIEVELDFLAPLDTRKYVDPIECAQITHSQVSKRFIPCLS